MAEEYLTVAELAARLKLSPRTIANKMAAGVFRKGEHFFSPPGLKPRFKWSAVVTWLEQSQESASDDESIPMPQWYNRKRKHVNGLQS
jgi:hypothetical protein